MITSAFFQFIYTKRGIAAYININKVLKSLSGWHKQDYIHVLKIIFSASYLNNLSRAGRQKCFLKRCRATLNKS